MAEVSLTVSEIAERAEISEARARALVKRLLAQEEAVLNGVRQTGSVGRPPKVYKFNDEVLESIE